jgi:hypothetical protein
MKIGNTLPVDFVAVKKAFERSYGCMGITCEDVGGIYDGSLQSSEPLISAYEALESQLVRWAVVHNGRTKQVSAYSAIKLPPPLY